MVAATTADLVMSKAWPKALKPRLLSPWSPSWARLYWRLSRAQGSACIIRSLSWALKPQLSSRIDFMSCAVSQLHFFLSVMDLYSSSAIIKPSWKGKSCPRIALSLLSWLWWQQMPVYQHNAPKGYWWHQESFSTPQIQQHQHSPPTDKQF